MLFYWWRKKVLIVWHQVCCIGSLVWIEGGIMYDLLLGKGVGLQLLVQLLTVSVTSTENYIHIYMDIYVYVCRNVHSAYNKYCLYICVCVCECVFYVFMCMFMSLLSSISEVSKILWPYIYRLTHLLFDLCLNFRHCLKLLSYIRFWDMHIDIQVCKKL